MGRLHLLAACLLLLVPAACGGNADAGAEGPAEITVDETWLLEVSGTAHADGGTYECKGPIEGEVTVEVDGARVVGGSGSVTYGYGAPCSPLRYEVTVGVGIANDDGFEFPASNMAIVSVEKVSDSEAQGSWEEIIDAGNTTLSFHWAMTCTSC